MYLCTHSVLCAGMYFASIQHIIQMHIPALLYKYAMEGNNTQGYAQRDSPSVVKKQKALISPTATATQPQPESWVVRCFT